MRNVFRMSVIGLLSLSLVGLGVVAVDGASVKKMNVADLTYHGDLIIQGVVTSLSDGFDGNNLPYTEVTMWVFESVRGGTEGAFYSFRQFGLLAPKDVGGGLTNVMVSPDGWPKFALGEEVLLFLYQTTSLGFQSTVGLLQGKFTVENGQACNAINNLGLFAGVSGFDPNALDEAESKLLEMKSGAIPVAPLKSFVGKAIDNNWFN